jgi:predicted aspartyl protease
VAGLAFPLLAIAQEVPPGAASVPEPAPLHEQKVEFDKAGRVLAEVRINDRGPYRFIFDTGANRSAISPRVASELGLPSAGEATLNVHGVTGSAQLAAIEVRKLQVGEIVLENLRLPVLPPNVFADADGILGVEGLGQARVEVDLVNDRLWVRPSTARRTPNEYLSIPARLERGLLLVDGRIGRIPVRVIIDTGAERTLGNPPLRDALIQRLRAGDRIADATVIGATPDKQEGVSFIAPTIRLGEARLDGLPVTFGDLHVFSIWGLAEQPALLVGMDLLGSLDRLVVDYRREEFMIRLRRGEDIVIRQCRRAACGSRVMD